MPSPPLSVSLRRRIGSKREQRVVERTTSDETQSQPVQSSNEQPAKVYFEPQRKALCAVHALNHVAGSRVFFPHHLDAGVDQVLSEAAAAALAVGAACEETRDRHVAVGGYYSEQVMAAALISHGQWLFDQTPLHLHYMGRAALWEKDVPGALIHQPGHWMALRREGNMLWLLDSLSTGPEYLGKRGEARVEERLATYPSIFLLRAQVPQSPVSGAGAAIHLVDDPTSLLPPPSADSLRPIPEASNNEPDAPPSPQVLQPAFREDSFSAAAALQSPCWDALDPTALGDAPRWSPATGRAEHRGAAARAAAASTPSAHDAATRSSQSGAANDSPRHSNATTSAMAPRSQATPQDDTRCLKADGAPEQLQRDVVGLLATFKAGGDCWSYLAALPAYVVDSHGAPTTLPNCHVALERHLNDLLKDHVNANAAFDVQAFLGDTMYYPLHVLLLATCQATGWTSVFTIDTVYALLCSLLHKGLHTQLAGYVNRQRYWCNGVAPAGAGKSPSMKPLLALAKEVMQENPTLAVGGIADKSDFHYMQSSTTAACIDKLRTCDAYLLIWSTDAGRCLSTKFASGGETDVSKHVDLSFFLDAAHGEEFSHQTMETRKKIGKVVVTDPDQPVPSPMGIELNPTNLTVLWLIQLKYFASYWCQLAQNMPIGLVQRILFSFGGHQRQRKDLVLRNFWSQVGAPIIKRLFALAFGHLGPRSTAGAAMCIELTDAQNTAVIEVEETLRAHTLPGHGASDTMCSSMPKTLFWLGSSITLNHIISTIFPVVLGASRAGVAPVHSRALHSFTTQVADGTFLAAVSFCAKRYLFGQAVLDVCVSERLADAIGRREKPTNDHFTPMLQTVLRATAGGRIDRDTILACLLSLRRQVEAGAPEQRAEADDCVQNLLQQMVLLGIGAPVHAADKTLAAVAKFRRSALGNAPKEWLREHRVPLGLFGPKEGRRTFMPASTFLKRLDPPTEAAPDGLFEVASKRARAAGAELTLAAGILTPTTTRPPRHGAPASIEGPAAGASELREVGEGKVGGHKLVAPATKGLDDVSFERAVATAMTTKADTPERAAPLQELRVVCGEILPGPEISFTSWPQGVLGRPEFCDYNPLHVNRKRCAKWFRSTLRCSFLDCPVEWLLRYYTSADGTFKANTLLVRQRNEHAHGAGPDTGRVFTHRQRSMALEFVAQAAVARRHATVEHLQRFLLERGFHAETLPAAARIRNWLHAQGKRRRAAAAPSQPGSFSLVQPMAAALSSWQGDMEDAGHSVARLIAPGPGDFEMSLAPRLYVPFLCRGMLLDMQRYAAARLHLSIDTKVNAVKNARGVACLCMYVKRDRLSMTDLVVDGAGVGARRQGARGRVQGLSNTTNCRPLLNAVVGSEDAETHVRLFKYLTYLWDRAHPERPLSAVLRSMAKDFAPGIEAARREVFPFCRPMDDLWHLVSKPRELGKKCNVRALRAAWNPASEPADSMETQRPPKRRGQQQFYYVNFDRIMANLYAMHKVPTADLVAELWPAFLRRCVGDDELHVAEWLRRQYSMHLTVAEVKEMHVCTMRTDPEERMYFLSWWAGFFGNPPGMLGGSNAGESLNSVLETALNAHGKGRPVEESLGVFQAIYDEQWLKSCGWAEPSKDEPLRPLTYANRPFDQMLVNGSRMRALGRSTAYDFYAAEAPQGKHAVVDVGCHRVIVFPRRADMSLPDEQFYFVGARMLFASGQELVDMLLSTGVLRDATASEMERLGSVPVSTHRALRSALQLPGAEVASRRQLILSLAAYNRIYHDVVYVLLRTPTFVADTWAGMRCTCRANGVAGDCEHTYRVRTLRIEEVLEEAIAFEPCAAAKVAGRPLGSTTTTRGLRRKR